MACYVIIELTARPGEGAATFEALRAAAPQTRNKDGCKSFELTVNRNDPENMLVIMKWASLRQYETERAWGMVRGERQPLDDLMVGKSSIRFLEITDV